MSHLSAGLTITHVIWHLVQYHAGGRGGSSTSQDSVPPMPCSALSQQRKLCKIKTKIKSMKMATLHIPTCPQVLPSQGYLRQRNGSSKHSSHGMGSHGQWSGGFWGGVPAGAAPPTTITQHQRHRSHKANPRGSPACHLPTSDSSPQTTSPSLRCYKYRLHG